MVLEPFDDDPLGSFDRHADQPGDAGQRVDQIVEAVVVVCELAVPQLSAVVIDDSYLVMGATPINAGEG